MALGAVRQAITTSACHTSFASHICGPLAMDALLAGAGGGRPQGLVATLQDSAAQLLRCILQVCVATGCGSVCVGG